MKTVFEEIKLSTSKEFELIEITDRVKEAVTKSGIKNGLVLVFSQHTTGGVRISEYEKSLTIDIEAFFEKLAPKGGKYGHNITNVDDRINAHSHLQALLVNSGELMPLRDGKLVLGSWQTIFFVEVDGPRPERKVTVEIMGE